MRKLVLLGLVIAGVVFGLNYLSGVPLDRLEKIADFSVAKVHGGRGRTIRVLPREPFDMNIDRVISLLPFCPSVKEFMVPPIRGLRPRLARIARSWWMISILAWSCDLEDDDIATLSGMTQLKWLDLTGNPKITDEGIAHLAKCTRLRYLKLTGTSVTGTGLAKLAACQELETLDLTDCPVTDETVVEIPHFKQATTLRLIGTKITEKGMWHFLKWTTLKVYSLPRHIAEEERSEFRRQRMALCEQAETVGNESK